MTTEQVWRDLGSRLRSYFRRRAPDDATADDLLQETFLRIHGHLHSLEDHTRVAPWVYRIARHALADHYRRRRPRGEEAALTPVPLEESADNLNQEVASCLVRMIECLPDPYRQALKLTEEEEIPQREVASKLGLTISGAKSRVQRGREMLKVMLLRCCRLELDRRGNVLDFRPTTGSENCCNC